MLCQSVLTPRVKPQLDGMCQVASYLEAHDITRMVVDVKLSTPTGNAKHQEVLGLVEVEL